MDFIVPFYQYYCEANDRTVEVFHPMAVKLQTWGAVCLLAKVSPEQTPPTTPVVRLIGEAKPTVFRLQGLDKEAPSTKLDVEWGPGHLQ